MCCSGPEHVSKAAQDVAKGKSMSSRTLLAVVLLSLLVLVGVSSATPIVDLSAASVPAPTISGVTTSTPASRGGALDSVETGVPAAFYTINVTNWSTPSRNNCTLTGDCQSTTKIPEPQSLVLVGSGLLSMAGYLRRRLAR